MNDYELTHSNAGWLTMSVQYRSEYLDKPITEGRAWDLFIPEKQIKPTALFFVHGGGWKHGSRTRFHTIIELLTDRGYVCATTDYRLNDVGIAKQLADVRQSYTRFVAEIQKYSDIVQIVVFGSSAGAHLALLLSLAMPGECGDVVTDEIAMLDWQRIKPAGVAVQAAPVTFEPWEDIMPGTWRSIQSAVGVPYDDDPELYERYSPMTYVREDSPPVFFMQAQYEHMFPLHLTKLFAEKMKIIGGHVESKTYPNTEHGFIYDITRWQQKEAIEDLLLFAQRISDAAVVSKL